MQYNLPLKTPDDFKNWLMNQPKMEGDCPCCGRYTKIYKRKLHAQIVARLVKMYKLGGVNKFIHTKNLVIGSSSSDFTSAKYWGLIYAGGGKTNGQWRLTTKGIKFIEGNLSLPERALILFDKCIGHEGNLLYISECLADGGFDYNQLMGAA